jgi:hypothetical protein
MGGSDRDSGKGDFIRFWEVISRIAQATERLENDEIEFELVPSTLRILLGKDFVSEAEETLLRFTPTLLRWPTMRSRHDPQSKEKIDVFLEWSRELVPVKDGSSADEYERCGDAIFMENLTAAWLGLYFLGIPFIHPWERVRLLADGWGGFPSGACLAKSFGDVYRAARKEALVAEREGRQVTELLAFSHTPLPLLRGMTMYDEQDFRTPRALHSMGLRYTLLQTRMYARTGYPIRVFVPARALKTAMANYHEIGEASSISHWFRTIFKLPDELPCKQSVNLLWHESECRTMPTCALSEKEGIYTLKTGEAGMAGNRVDGLLLASYRQRLSLLNDAVATDLIPLAPLKLHDVLRRVIDGIFEPPAA